MTDSDRLLELAGRYAEGTADAEDVRMLETALRADAEFRRRFLRYMNVDAMLGGASAASQGVGIAAATLADRQAVRVRRIAFSLGGVAATIAVCTSIWWHHSAAATAANFAVLTATTDARWSDPNVELALSSGEMPSGLLQLEAGSVEFLLVDGATVIMQGPVKFHFVGRKRIVMVEGRVVCSCPTIESRVTVETPQAEIVDLGTVFSVEARLDQSTRVAVLSGEVEVKGAQPQRVRKGEAVEVRTKQVTRLEPMSPAESERLARALRPEYAQDADAPNLLADPGFEQGVPSHIWHGTDECLESMAQGGRSGGAVRIRARSHRFWPLVKQIVKTGDISGKLVAVSVWGMTPAGDPLHGRQHSVLKLAFVDADHREFACASRRFLDSDSVKDKYEQVAVAATAPAGTHGVQVQLILNAAGQKTGSVIFDDAVLVIGDVPRLPHNP